MAIGTLVIARHHESVWNKMGKWTGTRNVGLTEYGLEASYKMGELIKDIHIDQAFISSQIRTFQTYSQMIMAMGQSNVSVRESSALNERDYGDYTGKNKWEMKELLGVEQWEHVRRGWDVPVPHGETLKMVYQRAVPFYLHTILPVLKEGKNVLMVSSGNAIRSITKYIEDISDEDIQNLEMLFGGILIYQVDEEGRMIKKEIRQIKSHVNA